MTTDTEKIAAVILDLCTVRGAGKTICPSEAARALASKEGEWRALMPAVRAVAAGLAAEGRVTVFQKGKAVDPHSARGPIRIGLPSKPPPRP